MGDRQAVMDLFKFAEIALVIGVSAILGFIGGMSIVAPILIWRGKAHRIPALGIGLSAMAAANSILFALTISAMQSLGWIPSNDAGFITSSSIAVGMATVLLALIAHKLSKIRLKRLKLGPSEIELYDDRRRDVLPFTGKDQRNP
ncbi:MAG: hypothetical protein ABUJ92_00565 [Desulfobacterales bacterium]